MKSSMYFVYILSFSFVLSLVAATPTDPKKNGINNSTAQEKEQIMRRDNIDNTDIYAIPLDESEIEDEEQINKLEKKDVFPLPKA